MTLDYHALAPEIVLGLTVLAVLVVDLLRVEKYWGAVVALVGLFLSFIPILTLGFCESLEFCNDMGTRMLFGNGYVVDTFSLVLKGLFLGAAFICILLSVGYLESDRFWQGEFYFLMLASVFGAVIMASSRDLITLFVGLELVTAPTFLMAGWKKGDSRSNEAMLKFFIIGVLSAAVLLFGMSLVYGTTGEFVFTEIRSISDSIRGSEREALFTVGVLLTLFGFAFKVSAVPFHFWTPDTYEGAPIPVTAYLSVVSKTAGFVGLLTLCYLAFRDVEFIWGPALWLLAALSMTVGNLIALRQESVVRLLGYSSIAQGGFILAPFGAAVAIGVTDAQLGEAFFATVTYLLIYALMNLGAFAVLIAVVNQRRSVLVKDWAGLFNSSPAIACLLAIFFFALAGIPPLAGWFAKFVMFRAVLAAGGGWTVALAAIAVLNTVIALAYYARVVKTAFMDPAPDTLHLADPARSPNPPSLRLAMSLTAVGVIIFGIFPGVIAGAGELAKTLVWGF